MTSHTDEIQRLIADIDNLLANNGKRLSKLLPNQAQEPREVLERIRDFLGRLEETEVLPHDSQNKASEHKPLSPLLAKFVDQNNHQSLTQPKPQNEEQSHSTLLQKINSEVSALLQPLQAELAGLLQERANLVQEIRQLEQRRLQNYSLSQQLANQEQIINEFLQVLTNRLLPTLTSQLAQSLVNSPISMTSNNANLAPVEGTNPDQVERLTRLGREFDQRLLSLDGTVNVVFEALQRNIHTYHESLTQALARMHSQGVQGEQVMASFVNNLTQYLQQFPGYQSSLSTTKADAINLQALQPASPQPELEIKRSPNIASKPEDTATNIEDLDAVLLEFATDAPPSSQTTTTQTPTTFQPDSSQVDEVDQLYASLFGSEDVSNQVIETAPTQVIANELSPQEAVTLSPEDIIDSTPVSSTNQVQPVDSAVETTNLESQQIAASIKEPTHSQLQAIQDSPAQPTDSSPDWEELFFEEVTDITSLPAEVVTVTEDIASFDAIEEVTDTTSLPAEVVTATEGIASFDTITALTDLLVDVAAEQQVLPDAAPVMEVIKTTTVTPAAQKPEVAILDEEQDKSLDNYIAASPQENLLSPEATATMPDISLDDEQLQLLDQDLANFDGLLNSPSEESPQELVGNTTTSAFSSTEFLQLTSGAIPHAEAELDFSPVIEKKKESTTPNSATSLSTSQGLNHPEISPQNILESRWYLGIDIGTTGISATLLNSSTFVVYPIYWSAENQAGATSFQQSFRLPAEVYLPTASVPHSEVESTETAPASVTSENLSSNAAPAQSAADVKKTLYSAQLKPYLQVAIPYKSARQKWEPVLQFNEFSAGPLIWVVRSLSKLLLTLKSDRQSTTQGLTAAAVGLDEQSFRTIINNIAGAICTCPSSWSEQYRFNVREALLTSKLVQHPQQVFFIEEAIASLLTVLNTANGETVQLSTTQGLRPVQTNEQPLLGNTLALNIGATATEMTLVDLPETLSQFTHNDFMLHSFAYGGKSIEQDIICQLLLPPKSRQSRAEIPADSQISAQPWLWQSAIPGLDQMQWQSLGLEELELPRVGEPDISARVRLQQRLESSLLGQAVLDAALALKLILQHQESFTLDLADQRWVLQRRDLESQVLVPFVRRLNRELNKLLVARGIPTEAINQAILTGGVASIATVNRWLKQKLPNAKIIQDSYLGENGAPSCSRVAYGLAMLPLHPQVLEIPRQQYTDYFLFTELLRLLPDRPLSFSEVIHLFEGRGVNTRICQQRLLAFLEGELPTGLIPNSPDSTWLTQSSQGNPDYHAIAAAPLFEKQGNLTYRPNSQQLLFLRRYLEEIKASTRQSLEEPYTVNFALEVAH
ncbi:hypothetical protein BV372_09825 [Nostoc sp. T09]|uniref:hypothetical protein n=1 Tax=Nostoc sp. T09 TaxID=1932621 RepID=UPI000A3D1351|nr:hypothetical protein [Nostoc sp. T09]OUL35792.1 hypothetical protein BV372_09825 [Nostoc sp. T09]